MSKKVAPTKVTGGKGFEFEDKVAAFFMCCLLNDRPPLNSSLGTIRKIDFQVRADGWFLDDILLTLFDGEKERHCAFSVKSNRQFSKTTAPSDFVRNAWEQYLSASFKKDSDRIGIITAPLDTETKTKLEDLLNKARNQAPDDLFRRKKEKGYVSEEEKSLFNSFSCPQDLADKYSIDEKNTGELLGCVEHLHFDFEHSSSSKLSEAVSILRDVLKSNSLDEAGNLWETLCNIARETKTQGGYVDLSSLTVKLRKGYRLKDYPTHSVIWEEIKRKTIDEIKLIPDKIAATVSIDRSSEITEIIEKLNKHNVLVLLGESGSGKTVVEKMIADLSLESCKVVWINTENLAFVNGLPSWEIFKVIPDDKAYLIIDGIDRFYDDSQFKKVVLLLKACHQDIENSPWKIIISCQPEEWARVQNSLSKLNIRINWEQYELKNPSNEKLDPVWQTCPSLKSLSYHIHLRNFLFKPKVLDLFARRLKSGGIVDTSKWIGESSLITWYWDEEIAAHPDSLKRGVILKRLAEEFADNLIVELPATELSSDDLSAIQELVRERILKSRNDRISFEHDLIADWIRLRILIDKYPNVNEYIKDKITSPMWCKALRLLGIHLLETEHDIQKWKGLFDSFSGCKNSGNLGQDLLLEASIFSSNPSGILEKIWKELQRDNGLLLRRFLNRFFYSATFPNITALAIANQYKDEATAELIATYRDPYWLYWIPVIQFLYKHKEDAVCFAKKQVTEIVDKWLRFSKKGWPARVEAAEIAIEIAEEMLAFKMSEGINIVNDDLDKIAFRAGLAACIEQPDRAIDFALTACSRKEASGRIRKLINRNNEEYIKRENRERRPLKEIPEVLLTPFLELEPTMPWPEGPKDRVDHDFQEICLETNALHPLISAFSEKTCEILFALLIEHPSPRDRYGNQLEQYTGMSFVRGWFPAFYTRGPFFFFLNTHPEQGLYLIISLINFATDRWAEQWTNRGKEPPHIEIEFSWGKKRFIGDAYVYYWHRAVGNISNIIPSALMAIEKWLYDRLDNEELTEAAIKHIELILKKVTSLSFIGVLISIGKKNQKLFTDILLPLLSVPEFYSWDTEHVFKSEGHQMMGWGGKGEMMWKLAHEFNSMPHRKYELNQIAINIFLNKEEIREKFREFRDKWKYRFDNSLFETVSPDALENLIQWFDLSNWKIKEDPEHGETFEFEMPKELAERRQKDLKGIQDRGLLIFLPMRFRRILNGEEKLPPDEAEKVWNTMQTVSGIALTDDDPEFDVINKENVICGGIAVLFKYFKEWLNQNPDKETWCIEKVTGLILNPPQDKSLDSEIGIGPWIWDRFCAEIMPIIWAKDPIKPLYRRRMAALTVNKHYETVAILFRSASELRGGLKDHFKQLINFMLGWSHARWKFYREQYRENKTFDVKKWLNKEINAFEKGKISSIPIKLEVIAQNEIKRRNKLYEKEKKKRSNNWKPPKEHYFDLWLMKAAFSWLPPLNQAIDEAERQEWLGFWRQALEWTINVFEYEEDGEISGTPSDWDRWVFENIAIQILHMEEQDKPDELWKPILNLGSDGHYWVNDFLTEWFVKGFASKIAYDSFIKRWKEMLEYAFASEKWNQSRGSRWYYQHKLWCELLGMNHIISWQWDENKKPIIKEMKQYYERWAKSFLYEPESAVMFINFLMQPAAENILFDGLIWLDKASSESKKDFFTDRHHNIQKPLANLLEISLKKHKGKIKNNTATYSAFENLLKKLIDLQNLQALEIQQKLI